MPTRMLVAVRRRRDLSPVQFRGLYESGHARMAVRLFGHLWSGYRRHYLTPVGKFGFDEPAAADDPAFPYDAIAELTFKDADGVDEMARIFGENLAMIVADERRMFDRKDCWLLACDTIEEDLSTIRSA